MEAAPQSRPRPGGAAANLPPPPEQERKLEQEKLSGVVKSVHRRLRKKYREGNAGEGAAPLLSPAADRGVPAGGGRRAGPVPPGRCRGGVSGRAGGREQLRVLFLLLPGRAGSPLPSASRSSAEGTRSGLPGLCRFPGAETPSWLRRELPGPSVFSKLRICKREDSR